MSSVFNGSCSSWLLLLQIIYCCMLVSRHQLFSRSIQTVSCSPNSDKAAAILQQLFVALVHHGVIGSGLRSLPLHKSVPDLQPFALCYYSSKTCAACYQTGNDVGASSEGRCISMTRTTLRLPAVFSKATSSSKGLQYAPSVQTCPLYIHNIPCVREQDYSGAVLPHEF